MKTTDAFFEQVKQEVKALKLSDVIGKYLTVKQNSMSDNDALCPFHGDDKYGNFKISDHKNLYKCFSCDESGDGIKFVREMEKCGFKKGVSKIALAHGIITKEQAEGMFGGAVTNTTIKQVEKKAEVQSDALVEKAPDYMLDHAFRTMLKFTSLSEEHRIALYERGLNNEEIEAGGYFTFPEATDEFLMKMYQSLKADGISAQIFKHVPGFATREDLKKEKNGKFRYIYTFAKQRGMGIPILNASGEIAGIQIRKDTVKEGEQRYSWFTSTYAEKKNAYKHGTSAGAPLHVIQPTENKFKNVAFVTEGVFKANALANQFNATAISLQGVGNFHAIVDELKVIEANNGTLEHIFVAFDADMAQNVHVYRHMRNMVEKIKEAFPEVTLYNSLWDEAYGKGIDDLIKGGEIARLKRVEMESFVEKYDAIIEELVKEHNEKIVKIKKEFIKEAFVERVFNPLMKPTAS